MHNSAKYVLITGGTSGIGLELARLFAKDNYNLILVARSQQDLDTASAELQQTGIEVMTIAKDLMETQAGQEVYQAIKNRNIDVEILVNDAGQGEYGKFVDNDLNAELEIVQLNIVALLSLSKYFLKDMMQRGSGRILNLSSIAGKVPGPYHAVYHGTKAFVDSFTEALHSELEDTNITITALLPGVTDTDFFNKAHMQDSKITDGDKADPAKVAKDGYDALMSGESSVISGAKNKMQVAMGNTLPDEKSADNMREQQKPKSEGKGND